MVEMLAESNYNPSHTDSTSSPNISVTLTATSAPSAYIYQILPLHKIILLRRDVRQRNIKYLAIISVVDHHALLP